MDTVDTDFVQLAVDAGQLLVLDDELDDEPGSPTEGCYFTLYRSAAGARP